MIRFLTPRRFITAVLIVSLWGFAIMYHLTHQIPESLLNDPEFLKARYEALAHKRLSLPDLFSPDGTSGDGEESESDSPSGDAVAVHLESPVAQSPRRELSPLEEDQRVLDQLGIMNPFEPVPRKEETPKISERVEAPAASDDEGGDEMAVLKETLVKNKEMLVKLNSLEKLSRDQKEARKGLENDIKAAENKIHLHELLNRDTVKLNMHSAVQHEHAQAPASDRVGGGADFGPRGSARTINKISAQYSRKVMDPNQGLPTEGIEECPFETDSDFGEDFSHITPYLDSIRRDHYLINLSPFGPNNQLRGFRDTLLLAIYLNRTIVMPPFFKHRTDPSSQRSGYLYQEPQQKLDGEEIAKLMPVITIKQFSERCSELDVVFLARKTSNTSEIGRLTMYQKILNMPLINTPYHRGMQVMKAPTVINPRTYRKRQREESYVSMSRMSAKIAYGSDAPNSNDLPCGMWLEPYRNMLITQHLSSWSKKTIQPYPKGSEVNSLLERPGELAARMMNATCRAKSVRSAAEAFINKIMAGKTYMAMHWRYDENDFGKHCSKGFGGQGICGMLEQTNPTEVGGRLAPFMLHAVNLANDPKTEKISAPLKDKVMYIAAPPKESKNINTMKQTIEKDGIDVYFGDDLLAFLRDRHKNCPAVMLKDQMHDFVSLVEMELCSRSKLFVYSGGSSWSRNILMERQTTRVEKWDVENARFLAANSAAAAAQSHSIFDDDK